MNFRVGMKVVCIGRGLDAPPRRRAWFGETLPRKGEVYTIRGFDNDGFDGPAIWLEEIRNPQIRYLWNDGKPRTTECSWRIGMFRPVVERKTDISIFTAMLTPSPERVS